MGPPHYLVKRQLDCVFLHNQMEYRERFCIELHVKCDVEPLKFICVLLHLCVDFIFNSTTIFNICFTFSLKS